ncbi:MAG: hypothetical protein AB1792_08875 [Candidatus Zixiibacteriota bacterium]
MSAQDHEERQRHEHGAGGYEKRDVSVGRLLAVTVTAAVVLALVLVGLFQLFVSTSEEDIQQMVLAPESAALRELRAHEEGVLQSYGVVDTTLGQYRIPIERAMELVADEAYRIRAVGRSHP